MSISTCLNPATLTDRQLHKWSKHYGTQSLRLRWQFAGLLPENYKRRVYEKYGYRSIFHYAARLAGMTEEQVRRVLNLEKRLKKMPDLKNLFNTGQVSFEKMRKIVPIATTDNQAELAEKIVALSKNAIETMARDFKLSNGLMKPKIDEKSGPGTTRNELHLSQSVKEKLLALQNKGIDLNAELEVFLAQREESIAEEKETLADECMSAYELAVAALDAGVPTAPKLKPTSRYISARTRRLIEKEHGKKCAMPGCFKEAAVVHHTARFSLSKSHDPNYLAPLCAGHHELAHAVDERVQIARREAG